MMKLSDFQLGDRIMVYMSNANSLMVADAVDRTPHLIEARIVGKTLGGSPILGWKQKGYTGSGFERTDQVRKDCALVVSDLDDYQSFYCAGAYRICELIPCIEGQVCMTCGIPCPHTAKPDAQYECFGCRAVRMIEAL